MRHAQDGPLLCVFVKPTPLSLYVEKWHHLCKQGRKVLDGQLKQRLGQLVEIASFYKQGQKVLLNGQLKERVGQLATSAG